MRVLQVINSMATGGAEKLLLSALPKYLDRGIPVEILLLNGSNTPFLEKLSEDQRIVVHKLSSGSVYNPLHIFRLMGHLRKYDVVHVHLFPSIYWCALAKILGFHSCKLVLTEHNTSNRRTGIIFRISDRIIYGRYLKIVAITEEIKTILISKLKCKSGKISVIPNGIDLTEIKNAKALDRAEFKLSGQHRIILQVSSFTAQKDPQTPIRSLVQLPKDHVLLLVGDGETKAVCERLVTELGLDKRVLFLGVRLDVPSLLKTADIVILSSHFEGLSLSSIEGMASGRPFIASEVPGLSKLVSGAGILFPKGDAEYLANEITKLLSDADYHDATVRSCLGRAEEYSLDRMLQEHLTLYNTL